MPWHRIATPLAIVIAGVLAAAQGYAAPFGSAFTYQGELRDGGVTPTGAYDLRFTPYRAPNDALPAAPALVIEDVPVVEGVFNTRVDFGAGFFVGDAIFVEVAVRPGASIDPNGFETMLPRQELTPTPYALKTAPGSVTDFELAPGAVGSAALQSNAVGNAQVADAAVASAEIADGTVSAADIDIGSFGNTFWTTGGNAVSTGAYLGTSTPTPLELRTNAARAIRFDANPVLGEFTNGMNIVGGSPLNSIGAGQAHSIVLGGGYLFQGNPFPNTANASFATLLSGGGGNTISANVGTIIGGSSNSVTAAYGTALGGLGNIVSGSGALAGGQGNVASGFLAVALGGSNRAGGDGSFAGGFRAQARNLGQTGDPATCDDTFPLTCGDEGTFVWSDSSVNAAFESAGPNRFLVRAGGGMSVNRNPFNSNTELTLSGSATTVEPNADLTLWPRDATTFFNLSALGSDINNARFQIQYTATAPAFIGYDPLLELTPEGSLGVGRNFQILHPGSFVYTDDSSGANFPTTAVNQFIVRAANGAGINTNAPAGTLHVRRTAVVGAITTPAATPALVLEHNAAYSVELRAPNDTEVGIRLRGPAATEGNALVFNPASQPNGFDFRGLTAGPVESSLFQIGLAAAISQTDFGIKRTPAANDLEVNGTASKTTAGDWLANSDARIKTAIAPVRDALTKILALNPVTFRYTEAYRAEHPEIVDRRYYNVLAQEFARVFPDDVKGSGEYLDVAAKRAGDEILQVDTHPAFITAIAAIQELAVADEARDAELAALRARNAALEARLARLEAALTADRRAVR